MKKANLRYLVNSILVLIVVSLFVLVAKKSGVFASKSGGQPGTFAVFATDFLAGGEAEVMAQRFVDTLPELNDKDFDPRRKKDEMAACLRTEVADWLASGDPKLQTTMVKDDPYRFVLPYLKKCANSVQPLTNASTVKSLLRGNNLESKVEALLRAPASKGQRNPQLDERLKKELAACLRTEMQLWLDSGDPQLDKRVTEAELLPITGHFFDTCAKKIAFGVSPR